MMELDGVELATSATLLLAAVLLFCPSYVRVLGLYGRWVL